MDGRHCKELRCRKAVVTVLFAVILPCPNAYGARGTGMPKRNVVVIAKLMDQPAKAYMRCGDSVVKARFRYRVIRVVKGHLRARHFVAVHRCPNARDFVQGARYRLVLKNYRPTRSGPRFDVVRFRRVPAIPRWKWDARAVKFQFYRSRYRGRYTVRPATAPSTFGEFTIQVRKGRKNLLSFKGHTESAFVFVRPDVIVISRHSPIATGCTLEAWNLKSRKQLWKSHLKGIGPTSHSKYRNRINLRKGPFRTLIVFGWEAHGRYIEMVDQRTGKTLAHKKLP